MKGYVGLSRRFGRTLDLDCEPLNYLNAVITRAAANKRGAGSRPSRRSVRRNGSRIRNVDARFRCDEKRLMVQIYEFTNENTEVQERARETTYTPFRDYPFIADHASQPLHFPAPPFFLRPLPPHQPIPNRLPNSHDDLETRCI